MSLRRALRPLTLFVFTLVGCSTSTLDADQSACAELTCTAGTCEVHGGQPRCTCSAFEQAALGRECEAAPMQQREASDEGNTPETAIVLQPSEQGLEATITAKPDLSQDVDYYVLAHQPDHYYEVWCETHQELGWLETCDLRLEDWRRADLVSPSDPRRGIHEFKVTGTEALRFSVSAPWNAKGRYVLHARELGADDHGDGYDSATLLEGSGVLEGRLETRYDVDHLALKVVQGHAYAVRVSSERPLGPQGLTVHEQTFFAAKTGHYPIVLESSEVLPQGYQVQFEDRGPDDHTYEEPGLLVPGAAPSSGRLETSMDGDTFVFTPPDNTHFYRLRCMLSTGKRCDLVVYPSDVGYFLQQPADSWVFKGWVPEAAEDPRVWLTVSASDAPSEATYTLSLEDLGADDFPDQEHPPAPLVLGETRGVMELAGDRDHFTWQGRAGATYRLGCDCQLYSLGNLVHPSSSGGPTWLRAWSEPTEFRVVAARYAPGAYTLTVTEEPWTDDYPDFYTERLSPLAVTIPGVLEYKHDQDAFRFELQAGTTYALELSGSSTLGMRLLSPGQGVGQAFAGPGVHTFTAAATGGHQIILSQGSPDPDPPPAAYQLTVR